MTAIDCDIVLVPSKVLSQKLIDLSRHVAGEQTMFTLDGRQIFPHLSLYMTRLKVEDLDEAKKRLAAIAASYGRLDLPAVDYHQSRGYLDVEYPRSERVSELQMAVVDAINPIRDRFDMTSWLTRAHGPAKENIEKYGFGSIGKVFRPHATLTRFTDNGAIDPAELPALHNFDEQFIGIGLYEMAEHGTAIREIATFPFR